MSGVFKAALMVLLSYIGIDVVTVDAQTIWAAEKQIESCEHCNADHAEIPFDWILDRLTGSDPKVTDYVLEQPAKCPNCRREVNALLTE